MPMNPAALKAMTPGSLRAVVSLTRPPYRRERRSAMDHLVVPDTLRPAPRRAGSVWAVTMMHNEQDVVEHVLTHLFEQGVDAMIVADNMSDDATPAILATLAERHPLHVVRDTWQAHAQGTKMTLLTQLARRCGADWVVPFDADELWFASGTSVADFLRTTDADVVTADLHNVFPGVDDDDEEPDAFLRLTQFDTSASPVGKIAFRPRRLYKLWEGNLDVNMGGSRSAGLHIAHYPFRSFEQMAGKLRHGRRAMELTRFSSETGSHWRIAGAWSDEELHDAYRRLQLGERIEHLSWTPIGPMEHLHPGRWRTWKAERPA